MQSNKFIIPVGGSVILPVDGSLIAYESGTSSTANQYIIVKGDAGSEMRLKPGQCIRAEPSRTYYVKADDATATITGQLVIGDGEFKDSAINATIAGAVTVTNTVVTTGAALVTVAELAVAAVGIGAVSVINDPTLKRIIFRNSGAIGNIALGSATITIVKAGKLLAAGESFIEDQGAAAQWYAIADVAGCSLSMETLK